MNENLDSIGKRLAHLRKKRGFTQLELAEKIGIAQGFISGYEHGKKRIYDNVLIKIADVLQVTPNDLLGYTDLETKNFDNLKLWEFTKEISSLEEQNQRSILQVIENFIKGSKTS
jgi:transcriptional regulator with XRE-family HTH domain